MTFSIKSWTHFLTKTERGRKNLERASIRSSTRVTGGGKTKDDNIQNVKPHIGSHELGLLHHDWIGLVTTMCLFCKFVNVTEKSSNVHKSKYILPSLPTTAARGWC
ncbi:hypothetical protein TNCV_3563361 [Trichonephila clavipes]|nr:hypothetical protein TNCV_3563361 [Trichonephila clavipes]